MLLATLAAIILAGCGTGSKEPSQVLRIGYQKWGTFSILKSYVGLVKSNGLKDVQLSWTEFPSGPPLLEALNAGSIDIGHTGDSPPLFAQAAGIPFVYFGASSASPESSGILVKKDSPIRAASDLRGRRIGFGKGTSAHTMVLRYLEVNGLSFGDVTPMYLSPADGRAALERGSIDAWAVWDPYIAGAEEQGLYRKLATGKGFVEGREYYLASRRFAEKEPKLLLVFLRELEGVKAWAKVRPAEVNTFLSQETGIPLAAVSLAEGRRNRYDTKPVTREIIAAQQALADRYLQLGLLPRKIEIKDAVLSPGQ